MEGCAGRQPSRARKGWDMGFWLRVAGALSLAAIIGAATTALAQTTLPRHHPSNQAKSKTGQSAAGRQITVRKSANSYLTLGGVAGPAVTSPNNYVLDTFSPPAPNEGTFTGMRGRERVLDNRFDGPGVPLFRF